MKIKTYPSVREWLDTEAEREVQSLTDLISSWIQDAGDRKLLRTEGRSTSVAISPRPHVLGHLVDRDDPPPGVSRCAQVRELIEQLYLHHKLLGR